jgi:hypothetical protein
MAHDRHSLADEGVQERALSDVGPANERDTARMKLGHFSDMTGKDGTFS